MLKNLSGQFIREPFAEGIAHRGKMRDIIQQPVPQKPPICNIHLDFPVGLPQGRDSKQVLNQHHFYEHDRICSGTAIVVAVVRIQVLV